MASSLFPKHSQPQQQNNPIMNAYQMISNMCNGNPTALYNSMLQNNPQFKEFVDNNKGKTVREVAREHGIMI